MTETTGKAKTRKATAEFETTMDNFAKSLPTFEMPAAWREAAEKGSTQARDAYARFKAAAEAGTEITEAAMSTARDNAAVVGLKALETTKTNADATFTFTAPTGSFYVRVHALNGAVRSAASNEIRIHVNVPAPPSAPEAWPRNRVSRCEAAIGRGGWKIRTLW